MKTDMGYSDTRTLAEKIGDIGNSLWEKFFGFPQKGVNAPADQKLSRNSEKAPNVATIVGKSPEVRSSANPVASSVQKKAKPKVDEPIGLSVGDMFQGIDFMVYDSTDPDDALPDMPDLPVLYPESKKSNVSESDISDIMEIISDSPHTQPAVEKTQSSEPIDIPVIVEVPDVQINLGEAVGAMDDGQISMDRFVVTEEDVFQKTRVSEVAAGDKQVLVKVAVAREEKNDISEKKSLSDVLKNSPWNDTDSINNAVSSLIAAIDAEENQGLIWSADAEVQLKKLAERLSSSKYKGQEVASHIGKDQPRQLHHSQLIHPMQVRDDLKSGNKISATAGEITLFQETRCEPKWVKLSESLECLSMDVLEEPASVSAQDTAVLKSCLDRDVIEELKEEHSWHAAAKPKEFSDLVGHSFTPRNVMQGVKLIDGDEVRLEDGLVSRYRAISATLKKLDKKLDNISSDIRRMRLSCKDKKLAFIQIQERTYIIPLQQKYEKTLRFRNFIYGEYIRLSRDVGRQIQAVSYARKNGLFLRGADLAYYLDASVKTPADISDYKMLMPQDRKCKNFGNCALKGALRNLENSEREIADGKKKGLLARAIKVRAMMQLKQVCCDLCR